MRKTLITVLIIVLIILIYLAIFTGLSFGFVKILSVKDIVRANDKLVIDIEETKTLLNKDYSEKEQELSESIGELLEKKEEYSNLEKVSTQGQIAKANMAEVFSIEYLWTRIGRHATTKGVNLKMDVIKNESEEEQLKDLYFIATGEYVGILQFVSALEDDDVLSFKVENFKMEGNGTNITARFKVRNIKIKSENLQSDEAGNSDDSKKEESQEDLKNKEEQTNNEEGQVIDSLDEIKNNSN